MDEHTVESEWLLAYKRGAIGASVDVLAIMQSAFIALICVGSLLYIAAFSFGFLHGSSISDDDGSVSLFPYTFWGRVSAFLVPLAACVLAYSSLGELLKALQDRSTSLRVYEGTLETVNEKLVTGIHTNYPMLQLVCKDETWEVYPRGLDHKNMLRPGNRIRVLYATGTRTIKTLWVRNEGSGHLDRDR